MNVEVMSMNTIQGGREVVNGVYRMTYAVLDKDAFIIETLQVYRNLWDEIAGRVAWYRDRYGAPIEVMSVDRVGEYRYETYVKDHYGAPLCWYCLDLAVAFCSTCGHHCCGEHAWSMRAEVREMLVVPAGQLVVECSDCVCK